MSVPLSDQTKQELRNLDVDPDEVIDGKRGRIFCKATAGHGRNCNRLIATFARERIGRILRLDAQPHGRVTPNLEREPVFPGQRWFDIYCDRHGYRETLPGDVETVYTERYALQQLSPLAQDAAKPK